MRIVPAERQIQGLLRRGYGRLAHAAYLPLGVVRRDAARTWLRTTVLPHVTTAERDEGRTCALNVAVTHAGLAALGMSPAALASFPAAFREGMVTPRRSRVLGDVDASAPSRWAWGGPHDAVHLLLLVFADSAGRLDARLQALLAGGTERGVRRVTALLRAEPLRQAADDEAPAEMREHFGFVDGVGQPLVEGLDRPGQPGPYLPAGEFVLGYPGCDGIVGGRPTVGATDDPRGLLAPMADGTPRRDLGSDGSYLVFRQLRQDVAGFRACVHETAAQLWPGDEAGPARLAAKLVGRWPSGAALTLHRESDPAGSGSYVKRARSEDHFTFMGLDPHGEGCPLGAHVRRANPRDALGELAESEATLASTRRHRLLRRGRTYGPRLPRDVLQDDGEERGLHFICLNADLERQFEFVQQTWLNDPGFAGLVGETDPLASRGASPCCFTVQHGLARRVESLPSFVQVRGGAYFFLPGIRALAYLCAE